MKIEHPQLNMTLVDSIKKKIDFVEHVIKELGLNDTRAICARAEDIGIDPDFRESFDVAVSRAVARLNVLSEYCLPLVKVGGSFIAQKGPDIEGELAEAEAPIHTLGGRVERTISVSSGIIVVVKKISSTPKQYPRRTGIPAKNPI